MKKYGVGIVGFGWAAGAHLKSFTELPEFNPVAIMSKRPLDPLEIKSEYGVDVKIYNDYEEFLADDRLDIVDICSPHPYHAQQAIKAAEAGKHLIIEKPVALTIEDILRIADTVDRHGVMTSVCFEVRFISVAQAMKSIIDQGLVGDIYFAECDYFHGIGPWYRQFEWNIKKDIGGSSLLTAGCHALDLLLWLTGAELEEVVSYSNSNPHEVYAPYEYDTTSVTLLKFKNSSVIGKVASVIDCMQPYVFNINMVGSHGSIKNNQFYSKKIEGINDWSTMAVQLVDSGDVAHHPYREQFAYFSECLDNGTECHNSLRNTISTHTAIFAADKSAETGLPVKL